jgi:hypothetical protein
MWLQVSRNADAITRNRQCEAGPVRRAFDDAGICRLVLGLLAFGTCWRAIARSHTAFGSMGICGCGTESAVKQKIAGRLSLWSGQVGTNHDQDNTKKRWVFGEYTVFCSDVHAARRIYEIAYNRTNRSERSGVIELADGVSGRWEMKAGDRDDGGGGSDIPSIKPAA